MMGPAQRHRELITDFAAESPLLRELDVVGVARLASTYQAGLFSKKSEMLFVSAAARRADRQLALVDPLLSRCR